MPATTSVSPTGNQDIDGILLNRKWAVSSFTFSFPTSASFYQAGSAPNGETTSNFDVLNATQQNFVRNYVMPQFAAVANVTFSEITETSSVHADLRFAQSDAPDTAWAYYPASQAYGGDSWYNNSSGSYDNPVVGNYAGHTFLHEVGHAFGLAHGHEASNPFGALPAAHDSVEYSIMTYRTYVNGPLDGYTYGSASAPQTLMMLDIAALQYLYGANFNTRSGNTTYTWSSSTGRMSIDGVQQAATAGNKIFMTLWDGGGTDTYDFSNYTTNLSVNLQPGAWTTVSTVQRASLGSGNSAAGNIANALQFNGDARSLIENAIGGTGNDTIVGNSAANRLDGRQGTDTLTGSTGDDTFVYGASYGADFITDFIAGNSSGDKIDLSGLGITSFSQAMSYASQSGSNTVFSFGGSNTLTLANVTLGNLNAADFGFATINHAPVVTLVSGSSVTASSPGQVFQLSSLFSASDPDGDPLTYYVLDDTSGGGRFMINGVVQAEKGWVPVTQAQLSQITFTAGSSGFDDFYFYARDGSLSDYETLQLHAAPGNALTLEEHSPHEFAEWLGDGDTLNGPQSDQIPTDLFTWQYVG
jgi:Ca2+-binding RTX toxin-like protein